MSKSIRVILEIRVSRPVPSAAADVAAGVNFAGLVVDGTFAPVPTRAATAQLQMSLDSSQEELVLIRGTVDDDKLDELRSQPKVVDVYIDSQIAPFVSVAESHDEPGPIVSVAPGATAACPIPPCDCTPSVAHGTLPEVARYLGVDQIWEDGLRGEGIVIGIVDGGITADGRVLSDVPGLVPRVVGGWPTANWGTIARWGRHGNMTATDALGMAPQAEIYDIRISDAPGIAGLISDAIAGIQWALERFRDDGTPQVLSNSWGIYQQGWAPDYASNASHPFTRKVVEVIDEGILVLFAAGNCGQACPSERCGGDSGPGRSIWGANGHPRVITVGAANLDDQLVGYSSQGPAALDDQKPDFCAISHFAGYFSSDTGTSAACPIAAGVVALLKAAKPSLSQEAAKRLLKSTAKDIGPPGWDRHSGSGILRAKAAYDQLVGHRPLNRVDAARLEQLEKENRCLRDLFVDLALERQMHRVNASARV